MGQSEEMCLDEVSTSSFVAHSWLHWAAEDGRCLTLDVRGGPTVALRHTPVIQCLRFRSFQLEIGPEA